MKMKICMTHDGFGNFHEQPGDGDQTLTRDEEGMKMMLGQTAAGLGQTLLHLSQSMRIPLSRFTICIESDLSFDTENCLNIELAVPKKTDGIEDLLKTAAGHCFPYGVRPVRTSITVNSEGAE